MSYKQVSSQNDLESIVSHLKFLINNKNKIVLLRGDLASGKTTLVKEYVKSLDIKDKVTSPTFSLQCVYDNSIYHYDVYNKTLEEFISLGMLEEFEKDGIHFVEWGDEKLELILKEYGFELIVVSIKKLEDKREYIIES
ncbi:MAG TPA: tRNA (adenosine(37)-N6)-threonylcarbamoyltransferase complex ATPase subunit type 1 TsaE [Arcobacter sp.]|nr:tRNA (adenosine(37)-N6)-threonylcarbamoyltransferase complex ATPase subunit type 1 TsaE [Arcobacter sp.]HIP56013.1 tRNA (adenosine(37)-N6)-threonylcarbamoyltransferase complex ATPase subunit type 1 TsaE [Arcobacter sp.]